MMKRASARFVETDFDPSLPQRVLWLKLVWTVEDIADNLAIPVPTATVHVVFPFHTIGRFVNLPCDASTGLSGTCVLREECKDGGGVASGDCAPFPADRPVAIRAATCCVYQQKCNSATSQMNTYFSSQGYPGSFDGGKTCTYTITKNCPTICQLRIDFLDFILAPPNGDGRCTTDFMTVDGGSSDTPIICGYNTAQHIYVDFGAADIAITIRTTRAFPFKRRWNFQVTQIECGSENRAPSGCLQYYLTATGTVTSFNYQSSATSAFNQLEMPGTRQLANQNYGACVRMLEGMCSIAWSKTEGDAFAFSLTNDVGSVAASLLGTEAVASQDCAAIPTAAQECMTDYVIIPNAVRSVRNEPNKCVTDRFCGLGIPDRITSNIKPFVLYAVTDGNEEADIGNRGFSLDYRQQECGNE